MHEDNRSVISTRVGGALYVTLNRPEVLNALTQRLVDDITDRISQAAADTEIRVIILRGSGRAFSAGADLSILDAPSHGLLDSVNALVRTMATVPVPVITVVRGPAAGGGVGVALAGDLVYAADDACFFLSFAEIGLMPDAGSSWFVPSVIGHARASEMALLGERLGAEEAACLGLITRVIPGADLDAHVERAAKQLEGGASLALEKTKLALRATQTAALDAALEREREGQTALLSTTDVTEGVKAKIEKRQPSFGPRE